MKAKANGTIKFKVQKEPLPQQHLSANRKYEWPFATMQVGECFYFPVKDGAGVIAVQRARGVVVRNALMHRVTGRRFATRYIPEKNEIGCWRIA